MTADALKPFLAELDLIDKPLAEARGLPNACYTDDAIFALEQERIFGRRWMAVAFAHDLPPGSAMPVVVAGQPIALVADGAGELRAFHNVCSFDGCEVVLHPMADVRELVGLYHGWVWDLEGRLVRAPYVHGRPECTEDELEALHGDLVEVPVVVWLDLVFVNLAPEPQPFEQFVAPILERLHGADLEVFVPARRADGTLAMSSYEVAGNWKIVVENDVELLHEPFVHAYYRAHPEISPKVDSAGNPTASEVSDRGLYGFHVPASMYFSDSDLAATPCVLTAEGTPLPDFHIYDAYPNLAMGIAPNHLVFTIIEPVAANLTRMVNHYYVHRDLEPSPDALALIDEMVEVWEGARIEDDVAIEAVQRGRRSQSFASTSYSPFWFALLRDFHRQVRDDLLRD